MKQSLIITLFIVCTCALLAAGCSSPSGQPAAAPAKSPGDVLYAQGENAFNSNYFLQAADDFKRAQENYTAAGDKASALKARDMAFLAFGASMDFPYNRSAADAELAAALPGASAAQRAAWLDEA